MPVSDWNDLFPHTIVYESPTSTRDDYGAPTYNAGVNIQGRVAYRNSLVRTSAGKEVVARGHVWLSTTTVIDEEGRLTLPDTTTPPIISVERISDQDGAHHVKVYFA